MIFQNVWCDTYLSYRFIVCLPLIGRQIVTFFRVELGYYYMARYLKHLRQRMADLFLRMNIESHDVTETGAL